MPNHIIPLQRIETGRRLVGSPRFPGGPGTTRRGQAARLGPKLERVFSDILDRSDFDVAADPGAMAPERVLVFEVIGRLANFVATARRVELEWLAERLADLTGVDEYADPTGGDEADEEEYPENEGAAPPEASDALSTTPGRFYMAVPTRSAFEKLRRLWASYAAGGKAPTGHADWWTLFDRLHDLRPWAAQDRIPDATRDFIEVALLKDPELPLCVEIELWFYEDQDLRRSLAKRTEVEVEDLGGHVLDVAEIAAIRYEAILASLPSSELRAIVARNGRLATSQPIMSIRPQAMYRSSPEAHASDEVTAAADVTGRDPRPSYAALLDGYPVQDHVLLRDRLDIVEIDVDEGMAPVKGRFHGTAMSSFILNGDAAQGEEPITRVLKVVPILVPDGDGSETPQPDRLVIKSIFAAMAHLKEGSAREAPSGPDVVIVNHSICDEGAPFAGALSAWGRALDYLSFRYKVLFVASAGNIRSSFPLPGYAGVAGLQTADTTARREAILRALEAAKATRGILAPAESVNALTIGAAHSDGATATPPATVIDPYGSLAMSNLGSALGLGFAAAVKPDLVTAGGRQSAMPSGDPMMIHGFEASNYFGQLAACPDVVGGSLVKMRRSSGTSNAAALTTRAGLLIADALDETFSGVLPPWHRRAAAPCVVKALLTHTASWREVGETLDGVLPPAGGRAAPRRRENITRYIGYGGMDIGRVVSGDEQRATMLADGVIRVGQRHAYAIPLPDELGSRPEPRRITLTLAWLTPTRPDHADYRVAGLDLVSDEGTSLFWPGVARRRGQPPVWTSRRGTLLHAVYEGRNPIPFASGSSFRVNVQASTRSTGWTKVDVPYALAVTFEVLTDVGIDIYSSIETRLRPRVRTR